MVAVAFQCCFERITRYSSTGPGQATGFQPSYGCPTMHSVDGPFQEGCDSESLDGNTEFEMMEISILGSNP
jgi:hypothetical protein